MNFPVSSSLQPSLTGWPPSQPTGKPAGSDGIGSVRDGGGCGDGSDPTFESVHRLLSQLSFVMPSSLGGVERRASGAAAAGPPPPAAGSLTPARTIALLAALASPMRASALVSPLPDCAQLLAVAGSASSPAAAAEVGTAAAAPAAATQSPAASFPPVVHELAFGGVATGSGRPGGVTSPASATSPSALLPLRPVAGAAAPAVGTRDQRSASIRTLLSNGVALPTAFAVLGIGGGDDGDDDGG
eukprot:211175-Chlamydomonas_euryale.AAC.2